MIHWLNSQDDRPLPPAPRCPVKIPLVPQEEKMRVQMRRDWVDPRNETEWRVTLSHGPQRAADHEPRIVSWVRFLRPTEVYATTSDNLWLDLDRMEVGELTRLLDNALEGC